MCKKKAPILESRHLNKVFTAPDGRFLHANNDISLKFYEGETLGIAGESGCGKSTLVRMLSLLEPPTDGELLLFGKNVADLKGKEKRKMQPPYSDGVSGSVGLIFSKNEGKGYFVRTTGKLWIDKTGRKGSEGT